MKKLLISIILTLTVTMTVYASTPPNSPRQLTPSHNATWSDTQAFPPGNITFTWQDNGDPDDTPATKTPLWFYFYLIKWNGTAWAVDTTTYTSAQGVTTYTKNLPAGSYAWQVAAVDATQSSDPWHKWSDLNQDGQVTSADWSFVRVKTISAGGGGDGGGGSCDLEIPVTQNTIGPVSFSAVASAVSGAAPGTKVILANGTYTLPLVVTGRGTAASPIILTAQTPGGVKFTGAGRLEMSGDYFIVSGFDFDGGVLDPSSDSNINVLRTLNCNNCRFTNSKINNYRTTPGQLFSWIRVVAGANMRIDHNEFSNHNQCSACEIIYVTEFTNGPYLIDHNYFHNSKSMALRIGDGSSFKDLQSLTTVADNLFVRVNGVYNEVINIKSRGVSILRNTFRESDYVSMRSGHDARIEENHFFGSSQYPAGSIEIYGSRHRFLNNQFHAGSTGIVRLGAGHPPGTCEFGYEAAHDAVVQGNRFDGSMKLTVDYRLGTSNPSTCPLISVKGTNQTIQDNTGPISNSGAYDASSPCIGPTW